MAKGIKLVRDVHSNVQDKNAEMQKLSKVYSTERIKYMLDDLNNCGSPDMDPFWHGQPNFRDAGIIFEYTDEELAELDKCANDPVYFIENYCTFKNDRGRTLVTLRDYQKRTINLYAEEEWDEVSQSVIPVNRRVVIMLARQTGKCLSCSSQININQSFNNNFLHINKIIIKKLLLKLWQKILNIF